MKSSRLGWKRPWFGQKLSKPSGSPVLLHGTCKESLGVSISGGKKWFADVRRGNPILLWLRTSPISNHVPSCPDSGLLGWCPHSKWWHHLVQVCAHAVITFVLQVREKANKFSASWSIDTVVCVLDRFKDLNVVYAVITAHSIFHRHVRYCSFLFVTVRYCSELFLFVIVFSYIPN